MSDGNDNVFTFVKGDKPEKDADNKLPNNPYYVEDINGEGHVHTGFLLFTSQHIAIMREQGEYNIPVFVLPLANLKFAEIDETEEVD